MIIHYQDQPHFLPDTASEDDIHNYFGSLANQGNPLENAITTLPSRMPVAGGTIPHLGNTVGLGLQATMQLTNQLQKSKESDLATRIEARQRSERQIEREKERAIHIKAQDAKYKNDLAIEQHRYQRQMDVLEAQTKARIEAENTKETNKKADDAAKVKAGEEHADNMLQRQKTLKTFETDEQLRKDTESGAGALRKAQIGKLNAPKEVKPVRTKDSQGKPFVLQDGKWIAEPVPDAFTTKPTAPAKPHYTAVDHAKTSIGYQGLIIKDPEKFGLPEDADIATIQKKANDMATQQLQAGIEGSDAQAGGEIRQGPDGRTYVVH